MCGNHNADVGRLIVNTDLALEVGKQKLDTLNMVSLKKVVSDMNVKLIYLELVNITNQACKN